MSLILDNLFQDLMPEHRQLVEKVLRDRIAYATKERGELYMNGLPANALWRIETAFAANMIVNCFHNPQQPNIDATIQGINGAMELLSMIASAMMERLPVSPKHPADCKCELCAIDRDLNSTNVPREYIVKRIVEAIGGNDVCNCHVCQLRRRYDAGDVPAADIDRLLAEAIAKDEAENYKRQYLTEKDLTNDANHPAKPSPWGFELAHPEQVHSGELSVSERKSDTPSAGEHSSDS